MPSDGRVSIYTEREYRICMVLDSYDLVHIFTHAWIVTCVCSIINAQIPNSTSVNNSTIHMANILDILCIRNSNIVQLPLL